MAQETIANWALRLQADASGLVNGLNSAAKQSQNFVQQVSTHAKTLASSINAATSSITGVNVAQQLGPLGNVISTLATAAGAIATGGVVGAVSAIAAAGGALVGFAQNSMNAVAAQVRLGNSLGITSQQAAGLQAIATRSGIALDNVGDSLGEYVEKLTALRREVSSGSSGPMTQALASLGINAREFIRLDVPEQFAQIATGVQQMQSPLDRNIALVELLGRRGQDLAPLFRQPASDLRNMEGIAADLGHSISQTESNMIAATVRQVKELGAFVGSVFSNVGQGLAVAFAPIVSFAASTFKELIRHVQPFLVIAGGLIAGFMHVVNLPIIAVIAAVRVGMPVIAGLGRAFASMWQAAKNAFSPIIDLAHKVWAAITEAFDGADSFGRLIEEVVADFGRFGAELIELFGRSIVPMIRMLVADLGQAARALAYVATLSSALTGYGGDVANRADTFAAAMERAAEASERVEQSMSGVNTPEAMSTATVAPQASMVRQFLEGPLVMGPMFGNANRNMFTDENKMMPQQSMSALPAPPPGLADAMKAIVQGTTNISAQARELAANWQRVAEHAGQSQREIAIMERIRQGASKQEIAFLREQDRLATDAENEQFASDRFGALMEQAQALGETARQTELRHAAERGVTQAMREQINFAHDMVELARERRQETDRLRQIGEQAREATRTPIEAFRNRIADLQAALEAGQMMPATFDRSVVAAFQQLDQQFQAREMRSPTAALAGSIEEQRAIAGARRQDQNSMRDPMERLQQINERQLEVQRRQEQIFGELLREVRDRGINVLGD